MLILSVSKIPKRTFMISNLIVILKESSTDFKSFQNMLTFVQWKKRCSMVSNSFSQKSHKGESTFLNLNSILFVYKILFNILYWNSLNLVSNVVLKGSRYIFSQSNWNVCVLNTHLSKVFQKASLSLRKETILSCPSKSAASNIFWHSVSLRATQVKDWSWAWDGKIGDCELCCWQ